MSNTAPEFVVGFGGRVNLIVNRSELSHHPLDGLLLVTMQNPLRVTIGKVTLHCLLLGDVMAATHESIFATERSKETTEKDHINRKIRDGFNNILQQMEQCASCVSIKGSPASPSATEETGPTHPLMAPWLRTEAFRNVQATGFS